MAGEPDGCQGIMLSEVQEETLQTSYKSCMQYQELRYRLAQGGICKTMRQRALRLRMQLNSCLYARLLNFYNICIKSQSVNLN